MGPTLRPAPLASFGVPGNGRLFTASRGRPTAVMRLELRSGFMPWLAPRHLPPVSRRFSSRGPRPSTPPARAQEAACRKCSHILMLVASGPPASEPEFLAGVSSRWRRGAKGSAGAGGAGGGPWDLAILPAEPSLPSFPSGPADPATLALGRSPGTSFLAPARLCRMPGRLGQGDEARREGCCVWAFGPVRLPVRLRGSFSFGLAVPRAGIVSGPRT